MNIGPATKYTGRPPFGETSVMVHYRGMESMALPHFVLHSPDGFAWGYPGSGAAELARCILIDLVGARLADLLHQDFKRSVIAPLHHDLPWTLTSHSILTYVRNAAAERGIDLEEEPVTCEAAASHRLGVTCSVCGSVG